MAGTFWALVPPLLAIVLALITKKVYTSLFAGILLGALFATGFNLIGTLDLIVVDGLSASVADGAGNVAPPAEASYRIDYAADKTPPAFLWHTSDDEGVNVINSYLYATALREHNIPHELHVFPHGYHGLGLAESNPHVAQWSGLMANWLRSMGWLV